MSWLTLAKLAWRFRYVIAGALLVAGAWLAITAYGQRQHDAGEAEGRAAVTAQWKADTAKRDAVDAEIAADNAAKAEQDRKHNDEVISDYAKQLAAAAGSRDEYYRLLQSARHQVRPQPAPESAGTVSPPATSEADIAERIDRAVAGALAEARANADQLDALIAVVKPQL